jgi:hypothetical protein
MSKKRFSSGLDDLFSEAFAAAMTERSAVEKVSSPERRVSSHKNFLSDLDNLLQEALEESMEKYESNQPHTVAASSKSKSNPISGSMDSGGLDALIRQTVDIQELSTDEASGKKRLTVAVDRSKLEKLKAIAKLENSYLKDLLIGVLDEYIEEYAQQKGIAL